MKRDLVSDIHSWCYINLTIFVQSQAIQDLPCTDVAYNDYTSGGKKRVLCFERMREALLEDIGKSIKAFDETRIYSLSGLAGIGKSTVAQTVAARADEVGSLGASFFFYRDEAARKNAKKFFTTIAFQLCAYDEIFAQAIGAILATECGAAATGLPSAPSWHGIHHGRLSVQPISFILRFMLIHISFHSERYEFHYDTALPRLVYSAVHKYIPTTSRCAINYNV